jgi:ATP/maltotriose-dependent transcriptional regulator MalT
LERLHERGEEPAVRQRMADRMLALGAAASDALNGPAQIAWIRRLDGEHDNLADALTWSTSPDGNPSTAMRLVDAFDRYWYVRGLIREGRSWAERALSVGSPDLVPPATYARPLSVAGLFADSTGDDQAARVRYQEALAFARAHGERRVEAYSLLFLAGCSLGQADEETAGAMIEEGTAILRSLGSPMYLASAVHTLGQFAWYRGDLSRAQALIEKSLCGFQEMGHTWAISILTTHLADLTLVQGDLRTAATHYRECLRPAQEHNSEWDIAFAMDGIGCLGLSAGMVAAGAHLAATARAALGEQGFAAAWAIGQALSREESLAEADQILDYVESRQERSVDPAAPTEGAVDGGRLTPREREVLRLLVARRSNRQIAEALVVSHRTATTHVTNILPKLGVESRTEAAALAVRSGLV